MKKTIKNIIITLISALLLFYITLPAINLTSPGFYVYICTCLFIYGILSLKKDVITSYRHHHLRFYFNTILIIPIIIVLIIIINFFSSPLFNARSYANRITINESGDFSKDIALVDFTKTPLLDKDSSQKLGDRVMGELAEFVSQYYVSDLYTQINYKNDIVRVTPIEYNGLIKYFTNKKDGIKGYIMVNSTTGASQVVRLDKGLRYLPSAMFSEDMMRHLRFKYPTLIFGDYSFEIDENGNPFFIVPVIKYVSIGLKKEISGVVVLNPVTGETNLYDVKDVPSWIDHVYSAELLIEQTDDWGNYKGGFWNSIFSQKNVVNTTDGYNYLAMDDDIYMYTGITSVASDESNLGFILSNLRTKETTYYSVFGAEEYSAMASAEGQVQQMKYTSTFPLLINLNGRATYLISLKDDAGLVKKYAFVDVQDYQKVSTTDASLGIETASKNYLKEFKFDNVNDAEENAIITIKSINAAIVNGYTIYYLTDENNLKYSVSIEINERVLPFIKVGDKLNIKFIKGEVNQIKNIE